MTVTVTVAGHSGTNVTPSPTTLTFTSQNWATPQTVTVKAGNDAPDPQRDEHRSRLPGHPDCHVDVTVTDDTPGMTITPRTLDVDEGDTAMYTVKLNTPHRRRYRHDRLEQSGGGDGVPG